MSRALNALVLLAVTAALLLKAGALLEAGSADGISSAEAVGQHASSHLERALLGVLSTKDDAACNGPESQEADGCPVLKGPPAAGEIPNAPGSPPRLVYGPMTHSAFVRMVNKKRSKAVASRRTAPQDQEANDEAVLPQPSLKDKVVRMLNADPFDDIDMTIPTRPARSGEPSSDFADDMEAARVLRDIPLPATPSAASLQQNPRDRPPPADFTMAYEPAAPSPQWHQVPHVPKTQQAQEEEQIAPPPPTQEQVRSAHEAHAALKAKAMAMAKAQDEECHRQMQEQAQRMQQQAQQQQQRAAAGAPPPEPAAVVKGVEMPKGMSAVKNVGPTPTKRYQRTRQAPKLHLAALLTGFVSMLATSALLLVAALVVLVIAASLVPVPEAAMMHRLPAVEHLWRRVRRAYLLSTHKITGHCSDLPSYQQEGTLVWHYLPLAVVFVHTFVHHLMSQGVAAVRRFSTGGANAAEHLQQSATLLTAMVTTANDSALCNGPEPIRRRH